jgi:PUA domain protein
MVHFRHRHRLKRKEIEKLAGALESSMGCDVFTFMDTIDRAGGPEYDIVIVNGSILALVMGQTPFLTVRGLLVYKATRRFVTVDMGAVPFVYNGADTMSPGVVDADSSIQKDDLVWIKDEKNGKPLAIGKALMGGNEMVQGESGKAVKSIHHVGDKLWKFEE